MKTSNKLLVAAYSLGVVLVLSFLILARTNMVEPIEISKSGNQTTVEKSIQSFTDLRVNNRIHVKLVPHATPYMRVLMDENFQEHFTYKQDDGHLELGIADAIKLMDGGKIQVELGVQQIEQLTASGSSSVRSDSTLHVDFLNLRVHGGSKADLVVHAKQLNLASYGAGVTNLSGTVDFFDTKIHGASTVNATDLVAEKVILDLAGASRVNVHATESLTVNASGASTIRYKGEPKQLRESLHGAANMKKID